MTIYFMILTFILFIFITSCGYEGQFELPNDLYSQNNGNESYDVKEKIEAECIKNMEYDGKCIIELRKNYILSKPNALEYITFFQPSIAMEFMAVLVDEGESFYIIEIYDDEFNLFQSVLIGMSIPAPRNLRSKDLAHNGDMHIVVRRGADLRPSMEPVRGDLWDRTFTWNSHDETFGISGLSAGVEFTHIDGTVLIAEYVTSLEDVPRIIISDIYGNTIQSIIWSSGKGATWFRWLRAYDLNNDGFMDLLFNGNDDRNSEYREIFIWENAQRLFVQVEFDGVEFLTFPSNVEGYVRNMIFPTFENYFTEQILEWDGARLALISERFFYFNGDDIY